MKYICEFCTTEFFSAAENLDGTKCWNCKKGRVSNAEIQEIDEFMKELDKELEEFAAALNSELGFDLKGYEVCADLRCDACKEDCGDPLTIDPDLMRKHPELFNLTAESYPNGLFSGLREIGKKQAKSLEARIYGGIKRKSGEYCRNCAYFKPKWRTEGKAHYSEGNCMTDYWERVSSFGWCKHYKRTKQ